MVVTEIIPFNIARRVFVVRKKNRDDNAHEFHDGFHNRRDFFGRFDLIFRVADTFFDGFLILYACDDLHEETNRKYDNERQHRKFDNARRSARFCAFRKAVDGLYNEKNHRNKREIR